MSGMPISSTDLWLFGPELVVTLGACVILLLGTSDALRRNAALFAWLAFATVAGAAATLWALVASPETVAQPIFSSLLAHDGFGTFFSGLFLVAAALAIGAAFRFLDDHDALKPEFWFFLLTAVLGMMVMARSIDLIALFVGLELQALSVYILVGYLKDDRESNEGGLKYFILGAFSSAIFLYSISLIYALTGATSLSAIAEAISASGLVEQPLMGVTLVLMAAALGFKVAAVPFHVWAPDAYTGGPTPVSLFITVASKAAAFAVMLRILLVGLEPLRGDWALLLAILSLATMTLGNIAALTQENVKRLLAYSSIAHAGYALMGVVAAGHPDPEISSFAIAATMFYLFAYTFMNIGAWAIVVLLRRQGVPGDRVDDFAGVAQRSYWPFAAMLLFMLSLGGIPPTAGFLGKWYVFSAALQAEWGWLAVAGVVNTAISLYYYLRLVVVMSMREPAEEVELVRSTPLTLSLVAASVMTLVVGLWAGPFLSWVQGAASFLP